MRQKQLRGSHAASRFAPGIDQSHGPCIQPASLDGRSTHAATENHAGKIFVWIVMAFSWEYMFNSHNGEAAVRRDSVHGAVRGRRQGVRGAAPWNIELGAL